MTAAFNFKFRPKRKNGSSLVVDQNARLTKFYRVLVVNLAVDLRPNKEESPDLVGC